MTYASEQEVIDTITRRINDAGIHARVSVHSDKQGEDTVVRSVVFKAVIALDGSERIVNAMADIGTATDRGISYVGSQVEPTDSGEVRYLLFRANINPYEGV